MPVLNRPWQFLFDKVAMTEQTSIEKRWSALQQQKFFDQST